MKVVKYDPSNDHDTQQIADLYNRNGMYVIPAVKALRPEDWRLNYQAKEMNNYGYFMIKNDDGKVVGGVGFFKYLIRGDAPRNVLMGGCLLIDQGYRTGATIFELNRALPVALRRMSVGHFISEVLSRNHPSLQLSKLNGYRSTPYSWDDLLHYDSYESVKMTPIIAAHTNVPALRIHDYALVSVISQKIIHNNAIMSLLTPDNNVINLKMSLLNKYPYYMGVKNFFAGHLVKEANRFCLIFHVKPGLFSALQVGNGRPRSLSRQTSTIKLPTHKETCHVRFTQGDQFLDLKFQPFVAPGYHRRGFSIDRKDLTDLKMSYAGFHLFFNRFTGDVYFRLHDSILLTDVFCQAYYQDPDHFKLTKGQNSLRIDMTNASYHIVKRIQFNDDQVVDQYRVLRGTKEVMAKTGLLLNHQDYLTYDRAHKAYQRKIPLVDFPECENFIYQRFFNAEPKDYLIEHANVHLRVVAHSSSNQMRFRPLILMKIIPGATLKYHYSLAKLDHPIIPANFTTQQLSSAHQYRINHALIGRVWEDEVVNLRNPRAMKKVWDGEKKLSSSQPIRFHIGPRPANDFYQLRFQIHSFENPVAQFPDGKKKQLADYLGMVETFGEIKIVDHKNSLEIVAPHSWLSLYLDNNSLRVRIISERATTVSVF